MKKAKGQAAHYLCIIAYYFYFKRTISLSICRYSYLHIVQKELTKYIGD